jgi:MarR family transcriptional regulator, temperature-dependent positive regulator of motility
VVTDLTDAISAGIEAGSKVPARYRRIPGHLARRFHQICLGIVTESLAEEGLSQLQFAALMVLDDMPGIDQRRLADSLGIAPFNAGQLVGELAAMGFVNRRTNCADRRAKELRLTARGHAMCQKLRPRNTAANRRILAALTSEEIEKLMELLLRVIESNHAYARPGAGRRKKGIIRGPENRRTNPR